MVKLKRNVSLKLLTVLSTMPRVLNYICKLCENCLMITHGSMAASFNKGFTLFEELILSLSKS